MAGQGTNPNRIAKRAGIEPNHVRAIAGGRIKNPGADVLAKIARALGVGIGDLVGEEQGSPVRITELRDDLPDYTNHDRPRPHRTITVPVRALVPGGSPSIEAFEDTGDTFELLPHLHGPDREVIKIVGQSMYPLLRDGYLVLVDRNPKSIRSRDVVVAVHNGGSTIKRYYKEGKRITLRAENPDLAPIVIEEEDEFRIVGKATTIVEGKIE